MRLRQRKFSNQMRKGVRFGGLLFVPREIRCYDGKSAVYRIRCSVCDGCFDCTESKRCKANFLQEFSQNA